MLVALGRILSSSVVGVAALALCSPSLAQDPSLERPEDLTPGQASAKSVPAAVTAAGLTNGDWAGIRAAYEDARHAVHVSERGFEAHNPGQRWTTHFDDRGFTVVPEGGNWTWGLELVSYGVRDSERKVTRPRSTCHEDARVIYEWDEMLEEWFINDGRGLEHGFTIARRPEGLASEPLTLTLATRGEVSATPSADRSSVLFRDAQGMVVLEYSKLLVTDATGRILEARLEVSGDRVSIQVDDTSALYPVAVDPIAQQAYLKSSTPYHDAGFGFSMAADGETVVVGVPRITSLVGTGQPPAAHVFVRESGLWREQAILRASSTVLDDRFGYSVAIHGDRVLVGAPFEDTVGFNTGSAYEFVRSGQTWTEGATFTGVNTTSRDQFGRSVALSDRFGVFGAPGINSNSGVVFVFELIGGAWTPGPALRSSNLETRDVFGGSVAIWNGTIVVGAAHEDSAAAGVDGNGLDNSALSAGAAYVFSRDALQHWVQEAYLKASNPDVGDRFGGSVSISHDTIVVGAQSEDSSSRMIDGDQADNLAPDAGAAYVFTKGAAGWAQEAYLKASNAGAGDHFGAVVCARRSLALVGAPEEDSRDKGVNGDQLSDDKIDSGAAYLYRRDHDEWFQMGYLKASNSGARDVFGAAVAVAEDFVVVGAPGEDGGAPGIDGDQSSNSRSGAGATYVYRLDAVLHSGFSYCDGDGTGTWCPCGNGPSGAGCPNSTGAGASLVASGSPSVADDSFVLTVTGSGAGKLGLMLQGPEVNGVGDGSPFGNGLLCVDANTRWDIQVTDASGSVTYGPDYFGAHPAAALGDELYYQWWYHDGADPCGGGFNFSNAWRTSWQ